MSQETEQPIDVRRTTAPRKRVPDGELGFGRVFSDHMFLMDWEPGAGWHGARIVPYGPLSLESHLGSRLEHPGTYRVERYSTLPITRLSRSTRRLYTPPTESCSTISSVSAPPEKSPAEKRSMPVTLSLVDSTEPW